MKLFRVSCCLLVLLLSLLAFTFVPWSQAGPAHATSPGQNGRIAYRPFAPSGNEILYTANPDGSHVQQVTGLAGFADEWSPSGTRIAIDFFEANGFEQIATGAPDGSSLQVLTSGPFIHEGPSWSPDETEIVFDYSATDPNLPGFSTHLWVMSAEGTNAHPLLAPPTGWLRHRTEVAAHGRLDHVHSDPQGQQWDPAGGHLRRERRRHEPAPAHLLGAGPRAPHLVPGWAVDHLQRRCE